MLLQRYHCWCRKIFSVHEEHEGHEVYKMIEAFADNLRSRELFAVLQVFIDIHAEGQTFLFDNRREFGEGLTSEVTELE